MADLYTYVTSTGLIVPDTADILAAVQAEFLVTFGADLNLSPSTPQGVLINSEALARAAVADNNATVANQINPNLAGGVFLDAIMALTGIQRTAATFSTLTATLNGVVGTFIPAGSQAYETGSGNMNVFATVNDVTIPSGGTITGVQFQAVVSGQIPAEPDTLTVIVSNVLGWESITANTAAVLGQSTQSDVAARQYRLETLFAQGQSTAGAIIAAVTAVPGVKSVSFLENVANTTQVISGVTMVAHSIYVCVYGINNLVETISVTLNGTTTATTADTSALAVGMQVVGTDIVYGTTIASITDGTTFVLSVAATGSGAESLSFYTADSFTNQAVAQAILSKKSAGANFNNGASSQPQSVAVVEPYSGQTITVLFDIADAVSISVEATVSASTSVQNPETSSQNAILLYASGGISQEPGFVIGSPVSPFELAGAITSQYPGIFVHSLQTKKTIGGSFSTTEIAIDIFEIATIVLSNIAITVT